MDIGLIIILVTLSVASIYDLWKREVPDKVWLIFGAIGSAATALDIFSGRLQLIVLFASVGITTVFSTGLYYLRFYGGADAKALIAASLTLPFYEPTNFIHPLAPIMILANGTLLLIGLPVLFSLFNLIQIVRGKHIFQGFESESWWRKAAACSIGYRAGLKRVRRFHLTLEKVEEGVKKFDFSLLRDDDMFVEKGDRWVTPGLPLIVFLLVGAVALALYGDLTVPILMAFIGG
ncbi:MAG: prepilin peptidase [Thaumarchaeota archaeon]|nr:prepilin peptidase [Nitrososphaerota archaeon]